MNLNKIRNINKYQSILRSIFGHVFGKVISEEKKVEMLKYFFFGNVRHVTLTLDILPYYILNCAVNILQQSGVLPNFTE